MPDAWRQGTAQQGRGAHFGWRDSPGRVAQRAGLLAGFHSVLIDRVLIRDLRREGDRVSGVVICLTETGQISILASVPATEDPAPALVDGALRQLRKMPGYRRGDRVFTLSPNARIEIERGG